MLDVTSVTLEAKSGVSFAELYSRSALAQSNADAVRKLATPALDSRPLDLASLKVAPWGRQLRELLRRDSQSYKRDLSYNLTRLVISLIIGICYGTLYQGQGTSVSTQAGLYNIAGALFASVLFLGITDSLMVQEVSSVKRGVFYREHAAGTYSCSAFSLSEALVELPYLLAQSLAYSLLVYWMIGFEANAGKFFWFLAVMFVTLGYFTYFGQMSIHLCPSLQLAQALTSVMFAILQLFCGYLKPQPAIPKGWIWLYWLNPVSYTLYGLVSNQLGDVETLTTLPSGQQVTVSSYVETFFGFKYKFYPWTIVIMLAFCLALRVAALTALKFLKFQIR